MRQSLAHIEAELFREATIVDVGEFIRPLVEFTRDMTRGQRAARQVKLPNEFHQNGCGFSEAKLRREQTLPWLSLPIGKSDTGGF